MARKRMLDPHIWESAYDKGWTSDDFVVMSAAISAADDEGKGRISMIIRNVGEMISSKKLKKSLEKLQDSIIIYEKIYFFLPNWLDYQTVNHPKKSKIPKPNSLNNNELNENHTLFNPVMDTDIDTVFGEASKVKVSKDKLIEVKSKNSMHAETDPDLLLTPLPDFNLPLLTDYKEYEPKTFEDHNHVRNKIQNIIQSFCKIELTKAETTRFFNIIMFTRNVRGLTSFRFLYQCAMEFHALPPEKRNLAYLSVQLEGKIEDAKLAALKKADKQKTIPDNGLSVLNEIKNKIQVK